MHPIALCTHVNRVLENPSMRVLVVLPAGSDVRAMFDILHAGIAVRHSVAWRGADELRLERASKAGPSVRVVRLDNPQRIVGLRVDVVFVDAAVKAAAGEGWGLVGSRLERGGRVEHV